MIHIHFSKLPKWLNEQHNVIATSDVSILTSLYKHAQEASPTADQLLSTNLLDTVNANSIPPYYECKNHLQLLATREGACNIFGQYNFPHLKRWAALLTAWEKNNHFMGDAAVTKRHLCECVTHKYNELNATCSGN